MLLSQQHDNLGGTIQANTKKEGIRIPILPHQPRHHDQNNINTSQSSFFQGRHLFGGGGGCLS
jgi:hypothetical protein